MTDFSNTQVLRVFPMEKREQDAGDPTRAGVNMPIGSEVAGIIPWKGGFGFAVICDIAAVRVWHPILVAVQDQAVTPMIGRTLGKPLGIFPVQGLPTALLPELPWPTSEIEAAEPAGEA